MSDSSNLFYLLCWNNVQHIYIYIYLDLHWYKPSFHSLLLNEQLSSNQDSLYIVLFLTKCTTRDFNFYPSFAYNCIRSMGGFINNHLLPAIITLNTFYPRKLMKYQSSSSRFVFNSIVKKAFYSKINVNLNKTSSRFCLLDSTTETQARFCI